ncbi:hypothetical protein [Coleofasciculus sp. H7-2]|uniref:hypothetical protein n=1 Tax=Coleofasciculus sp. H7-2 TaxID=3351545 RepID=UPI00366AF679
MAANLTIYCLEKLTDYSEFERLCHDLMFLEGYSSVEPLGGFKDKGRDAIHVNKSQEVTIFAYSVRDDWKYKLATDAAKIAGHSHTCHELVFITTSQPTAGERDKAIADICNQYSWKLKIYGIEWLRLLLDVKHPAIKFEYPQIFPPALLPISNEDKFKNNHKLSNHRLESYETLFYKIKLAVGVIEELLELENFSIKEKQRIAYFVGLEVAMLTDEHSFYLDEAITVHVVGSFVGLEDIFKIDDSEVHQSEIEIFRKNIRNAYRMIESVRNRGELNQLITSPLVEHYRYLKEEQDVKDQVY